MLTVVGEIVRSDVQNTYNDRRTGRPAYRLDDRAAHRRAVRCGCRSSPRSRTGRLECQAGSRSVARVSSSAGRRVPRRTGSSPTPRWRSSAATTDEDAALLAVDAIGAYYPLYPLTKGIQSWDLQRAVAFALTVLDELPELVPDDVRESFGLVDAHTALHWIHAPDEEEQIGRAQRRFRFEEALVTQLVLARRRASIRRLGATPRTGELGGKQGGLLAAFDARLPFELTAGQREIGAQIDADLAEPHPMNRLLQGEVGSGKTLVALRAMLRVVDSGGQAALLAPTEVLAQQHYRSIHALLGDLASGGMLGGPTRAPRSRSSPDR